MKPLYLDWNLGLGDAIICNGLVRWLARHGRQIVLPSWERNLLSVRQMFGDLYNVEVRVPPNGDGPVVGGADFEVRSIGLRGAILEGNRESFDQHFYRRAEVPFDYRWTMFALPKVPQLPVPDEPFVLIHGRASDGATISDAPIPDTILRVRVEDNPGYPLAAWLDRIAAAAEIHCLDSSFIHLVESVPSTDRLVFHDYARPSYFQRRKPWVVLK